MIWLLNITYNPGSSKELRRTTMNKFNIGDRVVVVSDNEFGGIAVGFTGAIVNDSGVEGSGVRYRLDFEAEEANGFCSLYGASELELAPTAHDDAPMSPTAKAAAEEAIENLLNAKDRYDYYHKELLSLLTGTKA